MDKNTFYGTEHVTGYEGSNCAGYTGSKVMSRPSFKQGEEEMAEVDTTQLSQEHGSIRHDLAVESARLGAQIGAEACGIRVGQGDIRREGAEHTADIRYDLATRAGDIRQEQAENFGHTRRDMLSGFADTRYNLAERTGDIRRELAAGVDKTSDLVAATASDIRREGVEHTNEIVKEGLKGDFNTVNTVKDARFELASRIENNADRLERTIGLTKDVLVDRFFTVGRDLMDIRQGQATLSKDVELNALKGIIEGQKNTQYLADKITMDGEKTRALINDHKYHDLNRALVERQTELVNCEQDRWHHRDRYWDARWAQNQDQFGAQFAAMQSQLQSMNQNFNSQLSETRQGMVNFGTMAGVGQTSSANNVR